jgi:hypothetical protein
MGTVATSGRRHRQPAGLSARSKRLWRDLLDANDFQRHELEVLARALEMADKADEMSTIIERDGLLVGGKAHPLIAARRDALLASARFWRQLKFVDPEKPSRRPGRPGGDGWSAKRTEGARLHRLGVEARHAEC